ncbi:MAG: hypothetical protein C4574_02000 [Candidatus Latescibacterota bacterium]|nr:MAG: hypothetical protein C4574_02000 [Candidatus Latescibacterota bacterium]
MAGTFGNRSKGPRGAGRARTSRTTAIAAAFRGIAAVFAALAVAAASYAAAQEISVRAAVESESVYMGQSFVYQIQVEGSDEVSQPDISPLQQLFTVEYLGGSSNNSQSISIVNGRMERQVRRGYVFQYRLTPRTKGDVTIPAVAVKVKGQTFNTNAIRLGVNQPVETEDFKLRMSLSRGSAYIGEPVVLTVTWYIGRDVEDFRITMPLLDSPDFEFYDPEVKTDPNKQYYRIQIGASQVIAEKGTATLDGRAFATISFKKALVPKRAGTLSIPQSTIECAAVSGTLRGRDFFDDFFRDNFFGMRRGAMQRYVVPSNALSLSVRDLPREGRPASFAGHIGDYKISASATPTDVSVGDPITLKIILSGPDYLGNVDLPRLQDQTELNTYFKIPDERADGKIAGRTKVFTQTIRAKNENVKEIPPIALSYFDTKSGTYKTASTSPIPVTVRATRVVTAVDAEGIAAGPLGSPLESWKEGIAYNYEGAAVLESRTFGLLSALESPLWLAALFGPPAAFFALFGVVTARRRREENIEGVRARGALRRLRARLDAIRKGDASGARLCELVLGAMREYLGDRLAVPGATLTAGDVARMLAARNVSAAVVDALRGIMGSCEAGAYAGDHSPAADREAFVAKARDAAERLEKELR